MDNSSRITQHDFLKVAVQATLAGGRVLQRHAGKLKQTQAWMKGPSDWVTDVDHASEKAILRVIRRAFPDHAVKAEESAPTGGSAGYLWMIDPLDGTSNYMHSFPMYAVSVALARGRQLEVGVIYDPTRRELFTAQRGAGAWLNGRRIRVSPAREFDRAFLATGFPFRAKRLLDPYLESFRRIFSRTGLIRRAGSAALDLAYTACGRLDGFWELSLSAWDMAAGALLIQEAGGRVSDFFGKGTFLSSGHIVAGNRFVHARLVRILTPIFRGGM